MSKIVELLFLTRRKDSRIGYFSTFVISWIVFATFRDLQGGAGPTLSYMKDWPMWLVWFIDIALVCWPTPLIIDVSFAFGFASSWLFFALAAVPSDLIRSWLQPFAGEWIVTPWPDIAIECLLVVLLCLIILPFQSSLNNFVETNLRKKE